MEKSDLEEGSRAYVAGETEVVRELGEVRDKDSLVSCRLEVSRRQRGSMLLCVSFRAIHLSYRYVG